MATVNATDVIDGNQNQHEINSGLESVEKLLNVTNPTNGMRLYVKSYHIGKGIGGGWFIYDSAKSDLNDGVLVFNGWVREQKDVYYIEDAGVLADSGIDNTQLYNKFINSVPEFSNVLFKTKGTFIGQFISSKSLNIDFNGNILKLPSTVSIGKHIYFNKISTVLMLSTSTLPIYSTTCLIPGNIQIKVGDILTFWDRKKRPSDGAAMHFETITVRKVEFIGENTEVTFNEMLYSPFNSETTIVCYWYTNPIINPSIKNYKIIDNDTNTDACIRFLGCVNPSSFNGYVENSYGHACSFYNCVKAKSEIFHCEKPKDTSIGGYGLFFTQCRSLEAYNTTGYQTRHAVDADSCYGIIKIEDVEDRDAKSALVGLGHNGFISGELVSVKRAYCYSKIENYTIRGNKQGINPVDLDKYMIENLYLEDIGLIITSDVALTNQYYPAYIDIFCKNFTTTNTFLKHTNLPVHKESTAPSSTFRFYGYCENLIVENASADTCFRNIIIQNALLPKIGKAKVSNLSTKHHRDVGVIRGFSIDLDTCTYDEYPAELQYLFSFSEITIGTSVYASYISLKDVSHVSGNYLMCLPVVRRSSLVAKLTGSVDLIANTISDILVDSYQSTDIPEYEFYRRFGFGYISLSSTSNVILSSSRPLPAPIISNGMEITLKNVQPFTIKFKSGSYNSEITLDPYSAVRIFSRNGVWVPI